MTYSHKLLHITTLRFIPKVFTFPLTLQNLIIPNKNLQIQKTSAWHSKRAEVEWGDKVELAERFCVLAKDLWHSFSKIQFSYFAFYRGEKSWKITNIQIWGDGKDKRTSIQHLRVLFLVLSIARLLDWTFFSLRWGRGFIEHLHFTETRETRRRKTNKKALEQ